MAQPNHLEAVLNTLVESSPTDPRSNYDWRLGNDPNIVGMGISKKIRGTRPSEDAAIVIYVREKKPLSQLRPEQRVPPTVASPNLPDAVTDVQEIGDVALEVAMGLTELVRPVKCGYSVGVQPLGCTGTIACLVRSKDSPTERYMLSNSHVLANSGTGKVGEAIYQPGLDDDPHPSAAVGSLHAWAPFDFGTKFKPQVDAAIGLLGDRVDFSPAIEHIGIPRGVREASRGLKVQKTGRTSGHTTGEVRDVHFHTILSYPRPGRDDYGDVRFSDLCLCEDFTKPGDSGSLVLDDEGFAVGLHFCGTPTTSIFIPIQRVLDALGVELVTA